MNAYPINALMSLLWDCKSEETQYILSYWDRKKSTRVCVSKPFLTIDDAKEQRESLSRLCSDERDGFRIHAVTVSAMEIKD